MEEAIQKMIEKRRSEIENTNSDTLLDVETEEARQEVATL
jgi:hypothetical protein